MLKYKILIKLYVLSCVLICCVYGDTILIYKKYVHVCGCLCIHVRAIPKHSLELGNGAINQDVRSSVYYVYQRVLT
jgi:hypothetical protein